MTQEHTPTPWKVGAKHTIGFVSVEDDQSYGMTVPFIDVYGTNPEANAAHIVKCVNLHDELVEALKQSLELANIAEGMTGCKSDDEYVWVIQNTIRETLKKAGAL